MKIYILKFRISQEKFSDAKNGFRMIDMYTKTAFGSKKNFMEYLVRSQNVKFADFGFKHSAEIL